MATPISDDPTWVPVVVKPTDGDSRSAANMNITFEALKWRTDHLYASFLHDSTHPTPQNSGTYIFSGGVILAGATSIYVASPSARVYPRVVDGLPSRHPDSWWSEAEEEPLVPRPAYKQAYSPLSPDKPWLVFRWRVPAGSTLTSVKVHIAPAIGGRGGNLPDEQPILRIWKQTTSNLGLMTSITTVQDAQATVGAYEAAHDLSITTSYALWGADDMLVIAVRGEEGNNAVAASTYPDGGLRVFHPRVLFSRSKIGEE